MARARLIPGNRRLLGQKLTLTEAEYRNRLSLGKKIPQGALVKFEKPVARTAEELGISFRADGSVVIPRFKGPEGALVSDKPLVAKTAPDAVRLVGHQLESVASRIGQAKLVFDSAARIHYALEHDWKNFSPAQRKAFVEYSAGITGLLARKPGLLGEKQKIEAISALERATSLLQQGNSPAASAELRKLKNRMLNWKRKLEAQYPRLQRRRAVVIEKFSQKEKRIWNSIDSLIDVFGKLSSAKVEQKVLSARVLAVRDNFYWTGLQGFKQAAKVAESAALYVEKGDFAKAKTAIKKANQLAVLAASPLSSINSDKLKLIIKSPEKEFKQTVLANQALLYSDMLQSWWNPRNTQKTSEMLEAVTELSRTAENLERKDAAQLISDARTALTKNLVLDSIQLFSRAAALLKPEPVTKSS